MIFDPALLFAGFAMGFGLGSIVALINYIITAFIRWVKG